MSLYKRGDVWWGLVYHGGRRYRRSLHTSARAEATKRLSAWKRQIKDGTFGLERHTWREAVVRWTADVMPGLRAATQKRYLSSLRQVDPVLGRLELSQINGAQLAAVVSRKGPTNATKRRDVSAVMAVLYSAEAWGWIEKAPDPRPALRLAPEKRDPIVLPTQEAVDQLVATAPPTLGVLVRFLERTGMRLEEAGSLEWSQVNGCEIHLSRTKTWRARTIEFGPDVAGLLASLPRSCRYVFSRRGERYMSLSARLYDIGKRAGISFRIHDLRHKFAVDYLRAGGSIYQLQQHLGHTSITTTEGYLAYIAPEQREGVRR